MRFNIDDYKGNYAMHCKTEKEAEDFYKYLDSVGKRWSSGDRYTELNYWDDYKEETCYGFNEGMFGPLSFYKDDGYTILEWSDFIPYKFTKSDLKNGDVILRRNGRVEIVCLETNCLINPRGFNYISDINEELKDISGEKYDVVAVRRPQKPSDCQFDAFDNKLGELVYERPEVEEMTLEQVCKALGKQIKIVG
jgi:hypothetical protein